MANPSGNVNGGVYPLGKFSVTTGTTQLLSANVPITDNSGIPAAGIPGSNIGSGTPSPFKCNRVLVMTPTTNTGNIFLIMNVPTTATAAGNSGANVILAVPPGTVREISSPNLNNMFTLKSFALDADAAAQVCWVTVVII